MSFLHTPVLLQESINLLNIQKGGTYIDGTAGGGGHSQKIADCLGEDGKLISIDRDPDAVKVLTSRFDGRKNVVVVQSNFCKLDEVLEQLDVPAIDGLFLDLGVSSYQLDEAERGFSYHNDAPLDMRMSRQGITAADLVATLDAKELGRILSVYGEEKYAFKIAKTITAAREKEPITTTGQLAEIVRDAVPAAARRDGHPARKTFQALRIAVNCEMESLSEGLDKAFKRLKSGGVVAVITFHSLEDRIVKHRFLEWSKGCTCPPDFPVCVCGGKPLATVLTKKPIIPSDQEIKENNRSRSAKLRAVRKI